MLSVNFSPLLSMTYLPESRLKEYKLKVQVNILYTITKKNTNTAQIPVENPASL